MVNNIKSTIIRTAAVQDSACKGKQILVDPPSPDACWSYLLLSTKQ
jgi:hypothetical protein